MSIPYNWVLPDIAWRVARDQTKGAHLCRLSLWVGRAGAGSFSHRRRFHLCNIVRHCSHRPPVNSALKGDRQLKRTSLLAHLCGQSLHPCRDVVGALVAYFVCSCRYPQIAVKRTCSSRELCKLGKLCPPGEAAESHACSSRDPFRGELEVFLQSGSEERSMTTPPAGRIGRRWLGTAGTESAERTSGPHVAPP